MIEIIILRDGYAVQFDRYFSGQVVLFGQRERCFDYCKLEVGLILAEVLNDYS